MSHAEILMKGIMPGLILDKGNRNEPDETG